MRLSRLLLDVMVVGCFAVLFSVSKSEATLLKGDTFDSGSGPTDSTSWASKPNGGGTLNIAGCRGWLNIWTPNFGTGGTQAVFHLEPHALASKSTPRALSITYSQDEQLALFEYPVVQDSLWLGQWVWFDSLFDFTAGQKLGRIETADTAGTTVYSFIIQIYNHSTTPGRDDMNGLTFARNGGANFGYADNLNWTRKSWHQVECGIKLNTIGLHNGWATCFADGVQVLTSTGLGDSTLRAHGTDTNPFRKAAPGGWYSNGGNPPSSPSRYFLDNVTVSTTRVGNSFPPAVFTWRRLFYWLF